MSFVPIMAGSRPPSPRTRELADRLLGVIRDYEAQHPTVTGGEIREATRLAVAHAKGTAGPAQAVTVTLGLGVLALLGGIFFLRSSGGDGGLADAPLVWIVFGLAVLGLLVFLAKRAL